MQRRALWVGFLGRFEGAPARYRQRGRPCALMVTPEVTARAPFLAEVATLPLP